MEGTNDEDHDYEGWSQECHRAERSRFIGDQTMKAQMMKITNYGDKNQ